MKTTTYTNNRLELIGRVSRITEFIPNKAAYITVAVSAGKDKYGAERPTNFIETVSFTPSNHKYLKVGTLVRVFGHISPSQYEKNGETVYNQSIVVDLVEYLETKAAVNAREAAKAVAFR